MEIFEDIMMWLLYIAFGAVIFFKIFVRIFSIITIPAILKTERKIKSFKKDSEGDIFPKGIYDLTEYSLYKDGIIAVVAVFDKLIRCKETTTEAERETATAYFRKRFQHSRFIFLIYKDADRMEYLLRNKSGKYKSNYRIYAISILKTRMSYEARLELLEYLFKTAYLNGGVNDQQRSLLEAFAKHTLIDEWDITQLEYQYECKKEENINNQKCIESSLSAQAFAILNLKPEATDQEVKDSYRALAKKYHPDRLPPDSSPKEIEESIVYFRQVTEAYQLICKIKNL